MLSVGNLYLVPTADGAVNYQPKAQAHFSLYRMIKVEVGKVCMQHKQFFYISLVARIS